MPVIHSKTLQRHLAIVVLVSICASCQVADQPVDNPYQRSVLNNNTDNDGSKESSAGNEVAAESSSQATPQAVIQLQNQALAAINEDQYPLATDYLQRAIKIQPRNAWSWHYLADIHWRQGQHERCIAMIERAESYAGADKQLDSENARLREQCQ